MMTKLLSKIRVLAFALVVGLIGSSSAFAATIEILNNDKPGVGFNDPTPVAPIGGNSGTTLGQQRFIAFQFAANIWGATLTSGTTITVRASWPSGEADDPDVNNRRLPCSANSAVLGQAGTVHVWRNFTSAPFADTWYGSALANAIAGRDLVSDPEINAQFNVNIGNTGCLQNKPWYYGLDNAHGSNRVNLVTVVLHELGHGLGFASFTDESTGKYLTSSSGLPFPSVFDRFLFDNSTNKTWTQMTDAERMASAVTPHSLVWTGPRAVADAGILANGKDSSGRPQLYTPNPLVQGSSVSHWDTDASPNQLMEPNINTNLSHSVKTPQDLTFSLLVDIGWCANCPPPAPPPSNDNFASAQTISGCSGSVSSTNVSATKETGEPSHNPSTASNAHPGGASVWYLWQAPSSGQVTINLTATDADTYDTMLAVYSGDVLASLTPWAKNDDIDTDSGQTNSRVQFTATAGTVYKIAVAGWSNTQGTFTLSWTLANCTATPPPVVLTETGTSRAVALDSVTQTAAPFPITGLFNFSSDRLTRVMIFTSNLGQVSASDLAVHIQGVPLVIESFGTIPGVNSGSYITVRLTDLFAVGSTPIAMPLTVTVRGVTSNTATIDIMR